MLRQCMILIALLASACSPYIYKDEVGSFAKGVADLDAAYTQGTAAAAKVVRAADLERWSEARATLTLSPECARAATAAAAARCEVVEAGTNAQRSPPRTALQAIEQAKDTFTALDEYAQALKAVVDAGDRQALEKAQEQLKDAATTLGERAGKPQAAGAIVGLFNSITATVLDNRRFQVLRVTVTETDSAIEVLGRTAGTVLGRIRDVRVALATQEAGAIQTDLAADTAHRLSAADYASRTAALESAALELKELRSVDPGAAADAMIAAHHKLMSALHDPDPQLAAVFAVVRSFAKQAQAVRDALAPQPAAASGNTP